MTKNDNNKIKQVTTAQLKATNNLYNKNVNNNKQSILSNSEDDNSF